MRHALILGGLLLPALLSGQTLDSLPFRAGQWGAEFTMTGGFNGVGLLRFATPTRAWLLDARGSYSTNSPPDGFDEAVTQLRFGSRWYRAPRARILQQVSAGVEGGTNDARRDVRLDSVRTATLSSRARSLGAFIDLGAGWLVTEHLAVGAEWSVSARYQRANNESLRPIALSSSGPVYVEERDRRHGWGAAFGQLVLRTSLFF